MVTLDIKVSEDVSGECILSHEALSKQPRDCDGASANDPCFQCDFYDKKLEEFKGTFVLYHKGVLCGQSEAKKSLFEKGKGYYGLSNLVVYEVPEEEFGLKEAIRTAKGDH